MPMALGMNTISNCDFMPYTIAASLQMSDEPIISPSETTALFPLFEKAFPNTQKTVPHARILT